jgi:hypothetical protein
VPTSFRSRHGAKRSGSAMPMPEPLIVTPPVARLAAVGVNL